LRVGDRRGGANHLDAKLGELAKTAVLRTLASKRRPPVGKLHRLRLAGKPVFEVRAHHAGGELRAQGDGFPAGIGEGKHFLGHDVGVPSGSASKQRRVLKDRRINPGESVPIYQRLDGAADIRQVGLLGRQLVAETAQRVRHRRAGTGGKRFGCSWHRGLLLLLRKKHGVQAKSKIDVRLLG